jgi:protease I
MDIADRAIAIVVTDLFEESELTEPKAALEAAGAKVDILAPHAGQLQAVRHDHKTITVSVDQTLRGANPDDYDAVLLPGGALNADELRASEIAQEFVRAFEEAGKLVGVICHGSWLLISTGLVQGRRLTSYYTMADDLRNAGAEWVDEEVVVDDNWVSSRRPDDLPAFNRAFMKVLDEYA